MWFCPNVIYHVDVEQFWFIKVVVLMHQWLEAETSMTVGKSCLVGQR